MSLKRSTAHSHTEAVGSQLMKHACKTQKELELGQLLFSRGCYIRRPVKLTGLHSREEQLHYQ